MAMQFDQTFISWILLIHQDAKTVLLLDPVSAPFEVSFSVRQGDPAAMILYIIYVEPLLLLFMERLPGYVLRAEIRGLPQPTEEEGATETAEGFVDDSELVVISDEDFRTIDEIVGKFEAVSGAILNRNKKSKVLGLGSWKTREVWPLPWLKCESQMKVLGTILHPCLKRS